jgi:TonB-linked SusC/RagA family outer membrane protein
MKRLTYLVLCLLFVTAWPGNAQEQNIRGTVIDAGNNEPLPGVVVQIKGTTKGTLTDIKGNFSLTVNSIDSLLQFSFLGYLDEVVKLTDKNDLIISLVPEVKTIDEVVVIGYGTSLKKDLTGASANVTSKDFNQGPVTNALQQISGRAAGVNITQTGSEPGKAPRVRIRGITSLIGGSDPLVVVDGVQGNMDLLNQIAPGDIESIDILKDASATAIYGSRGASGVILVSTRKSKAGQFTVEYNVTASVDVLANKLKVMNADEWEKEAKVMKVDTTANFHANTDWYKEMTQPGYTQNHTLSFGGGSDKFNYRASLSAVLQNGVVIHSKNENYIARLQATQKAWDDKITLTLNMSSGIQNNTGSPTGVGRAEFTSNLITNAYKNRPTDPVYNEDGTYFSDPHFFQYINPVALADNVTNESINNSFFGSLRSDVEIVKGLTAGWFGSWRKLDKNLGYYAPVVSTSPEGVSNNGIGRINTDYQDELLQDLSLNYKKVMGNHSLNVMGVYEWQKQTYTGSFVQGRGFINDITKYYALQLGTLASAQPGDISSYKNDRRLVSYLGRISYSYLDRYLLTASIRRDGSTVFGTDNKWGNFPSVSVAWKLSEESFIKNLNIFNDLKIRVGYGITGNQQGLSPQKSLELVGNSGQVYVNGALVTNFTVTQNGNPDLKWETREQTNFGLDFSIFNNRVFGSVDYYTATTKNLLFNYTVPQPPYPYNTIVANVGSLSNKGTEISLNWRAITRKDMTFTLSGNFSYLRNKVISLSGELNGIELNTDTINWGTNMYLIEGEPIGTFNILKHQGVDSLGKEHVAGEDSKGNIDQGDRSPYRHNEGSALPTYTYAFTPTFTYKNFDISMVWRGSGGNKIYNSLKQNLSVLQFTGKQNMLESSVSTGVVSTNYGSDLWLEDGSFLRFENLMLGYKFATQNMKHIGGIRISFIASNLWVFTKYSGVDPEINTNGSYDASANGLGDGSSFGIDNGIYPRTRTYALGLNVIFK